MSKYSRTALALMRTQPLHKGHCWIINEMLQSADTVILGLGSCDKAGTRSNPFSGEQRIQMIKNVYGSRVKCVPFNDLGATSDTSDWIDYVLKKLDGINLPEPTDYYTGSKADAIWYAKRFWNEQTSDIPRPPETFSPLKTQSFYTSDGRLRHLHLFDRETNVFPPATEIRTYIELRSPEWQAYVPAVNHDFVRLNYPQEYLVG